MVVKTFQYKGDKPIGYLSDDIKDALRSAGIELGIQSLTRVKGSENTSVKMVTQDYGWMVRVQSDNQDVINSVASVLGMGGNSSSNEENGEDRPPEPEEDYDEDKPLYPYLPESGDVDNPLAATIKVFESGVYELEDEESTQSGSLGVIIVSGPTDTLAIITDDDFDWTDAAIDDFSQRIAKEMKESKEK